MNDFAGTPGSISLSPEKGIPSSKGTLPPHGTPIVREVLDEKNRDRARGEDEKVNFYGYRDATIQRLVDQLREMQRQLRSLQSQIIDLRIGLKGLQ